MATPTDKSTFIEYCLRKLGHPVIKINVSADQIDDRVSQACYRWREKHNRGSEMIYVFVRLSHEDLHREFLILPPDTVGVSEVFIASNTSNIYSLDFQMQLAEIMALSKTSFSGISYYYTLKMHLELLQELFSPAPQYNFNVLSKKLIIAGGLKNIFYQNGGLTCMRVYRQINDETNATEHNPAVNIWQDNWLQNYTTSLIKKQWAQNMGKYANISLLGGVTLNAAELMAEAEKELAELEEELITTYSDPPVGLIG